MFNKLVIKTLFFNTLQKEVRNKSLIFLMGLTIAGLVLVTLGINFVSKSLLTDQGGAIFGNRSFDVILIFINLWSTFICAFLASGCVRSDIDSKVISQLLSYPIKRWEYLFSRIFGISVIVFSYYLLTYIVALILFSASAGELVGGPNLIGALAVHYFKILAVSSWAILFSLNLSRLVSFVSSLVAMFLISLANTSVKGISWSDLIGEFNIFTFLAKVIDLIFPRVGHLAEVSNNILLGKEISSDFLVSGVGHYLITFPLLCFIIYFIFRKKEIN